jgi:hypothetical protein
MGRAHQLGKTTGLAVLTATEREELEQMGAANVRARLLIHAGGRRSVLDSFLQSGDPLRGDIENWLGEHAKIEAIAQQKQQRVLLRWVRLSAIAAITAIVLIGWIAWRPDSYIAAMDRLATLIVDAVEAARGGLWRH